jgi:hypothetical protein
MRELLANLCVSVCSLHALLAMDFCKLCFPYACLPSCLPACLPACLLPCLQA